MTINLSMNVITIIITAIWGANHSYSQLRAELQRTQLQRVREAGMQGRLWLLATSTHYDHRAQPRLKVFDFSRGRKTGCSGKPSWHSREPTHNSTHMWPRPGIETWVTLVRGECFTHTPTMPPKCEFEYEKILSTRMSMTLSLNKTLSWILSVSLNLRKDSETV